MKVLVIIPARGGSKGLPGKNIKPLQGIPMIQYTIDAARENFADECIIVSTDSEEIRTVVEQAGLSVPFIRPSELATDTANSQDVLKHALAFFEKEHEEPDMVILLQVTSPLRVGEQVKEAIQLYSPDIDMVVSVKETESNPYYSLVEENEDGFLERSKQANFTRRQDCPVVWEVNGAIYVINPKSLKSKPMGEFKKIKKYPMDTISSIDVDTQLDFDLVSLVLKNRINEI